MFQIYDGREYFYQWDKDRKLIVMDGSIKEVHFCNRTEECSLRREVYEDGELHLVNVPNILLQDNYKINVYGYDGNYTKINTTFVVKARSKPDDYISTEEELKEWEELEARIKALEENGGSNVDLTGYATEEYVNNAIANINIPEPVVESKPMNYRVLEKHYIDGTKIYTIADDTYFIRYYAVKKGLTYKVCGEGVRHLNMNLATFDDTLNVGASGVSGAEVVIIDNSTATTVTDYEVEFTPTVDGYILINCCTNFNPLRVETYEETVKTPLNIQVFGDSMTDNTWNNTKSSWLDELPNYLPEYDLNIINSAIGGNTLIKWQNGDLYKGIAWQVGLTEATQGVANSTATKDTYDPVRSDSDLVIVWAGANDWAGTTATTLGDTAALNPNTALTEIDISKVFGAVRAIIETVNTKTNAKLLFITPTQRYSTTGNSPDSAQPVDENGEVIRNEHTLQEYVDAIRFACASFGVPCLDAYRECGINRFSLSKYTDDGLHANTAGEKLLAAFIAKAIKDNPSGSSFCCYYKDGEGVAY